MQGWRSPEASGCIRTALAVRREASVMSEKGQETSGIQRTGADEKIVCKELKAFCWGPVQDQGWSFQVRRIMGATILEYLGMNL